MTTRTDIHAAVQRAFTVIPPAEAANHRWLTHTYETVIEHLTAPNYGQLQARLRLLFGKNPKVDLHDFYQRGADGFIGHWREYLPGELTQMLTWSGFHEVRSTTFCDPWYAWEKRPSVHAAKDLVIHPLSKFIPGAQYELLSVSIKR